MAFKENPLSLSLSQTAFEAWLRENGHLEALDRTGLDHHLRLPSHSSFKEFSKSVKSHPFMNLTVNDLLKKPVSWTDEFFDCGLGPGETYSWPRSIAQAKLRMDENIQRYIGNYVVLVAIVFLILLYQMPIAFLGIISVILVWDTLRRAGAEWGLERNGYRYRALAFVGNTVTVVLMVYCKIALALFWAGIASILVVTAHSCLRRITRPKVVPHKREQVVTHKREHVVSHNREQVVSHNREQVVSHNREQVVSHKREQVVSHKREQVVPHKHLQHESELR